MPAIVQGISPGFKVPITMTLKPYNDLYDKYIHCFKSVGRTNQKCTYESIKCLMLHCNIIYDSKTQK